MSKRRTYLVVGLLALVGLVSTSLLTIPFYEAGVPTSYAVAIGFGAIAPGIIFFGYSFNGQLDFDAYHDRENVLVDVIGVAAGAMATAIVGLTVLVFVAPGFASSSSVAIGLSLAGGYAIFIRRNRAYFDDDVNPWLGRLGDWLR